MVRQCFVLTDLGHWMGKKYEHGGRILGTCTEKDLFFFDMYTLLYLFILATLSLCCCTWAFSSCRARGPLSSCSAWAFIVVASRCRAQASVVEALELSSCKLAGSWALGLSSCSSRPLEHGLSSCGTPG